MTQKNEEPYDFERCTIRIAIALLPTQAGSERQALVTLSSHKDFPLIAQCPYAELWSAIERGLERLKQEMPQRHLDWLNRQPKPKKAQPTTAIAPQSQSKQKPNTTVVQVRLFDL
jgi:hypothetical protein